jgi:hypothetical protein
LGGREEAGNENEGEGRTEGRRGYGGKKEGGTRKEEGGRRKKEEGGGRRDQVTFVT